MAAHAAAGLVAGGPGLPKPGVATGPHGGDLRRT